MNEEAKRRKRDKGDITLVIDNIADRLSAEESKNQHLGTSLQNMGEITATILELTHIGNILDSQDEQDRQTISLWGMHEKDRAMDYKISTHKMRKGKINNVKLS